MAGKQTKQRQSNFELIRIIAMFLIIVHHSVVHGALSGSATTIMSKSNPLTVGLFNFIAIGGKIGVYLFVLITGYFMLHSKISFKKIIKLWLPIFFWSVLLTLICGGVITHELNVSNFIESAFPIIFNQYWFMSAYVFMYFLVPLLNKMLLSIDTKEEILLVLVGIAVIFPSTHFYGSVTYSWLLYFCFAYCFGGLIRKHDLLHQNWFKIFTMSIFWLSTIANILISFGFSFIGIKFHKQALLKHANLTIVCLLLAISIFAWIGSKNIGYNKYINKVAATAFGIYLIHDNNFVRSFLWNDLLHMKHLVFQPAYIVLYDLLLCVAIFVICSLLEFIRQLLFKHLENDIAVAADTAWNNFSNKLVNKFRGKA